MSVTDAIVIGEAWISEHYFTTDAKSQSFQAKVLERRKVWDAEAAEGRSTVRSRFTEARPGLEIDLGSLAERSDPASASEAADLIHERLLTVLGLDAHGLHLDRDGRVLRVSSPGISRGAPLVVILASPVGAIEELLAKDGHTLPVTVQLADGPDVSSAARLVSALFVASDAPDLALVLAGRWALLTDRERWAEGRYLAIDLQLVCERNDTRRGGEIDRSMTCLASESIAPDADGDLWWHAVLEESITHTVGVSKDLRDGVRLSIEILANEVVTRRREKALTPLTADQAQPLAQQSLRFLYRILFLLYAEASPELGVLPVGAPEYAQGYGLDRLRDLVQVELATPQARSGTHLYDSLGVLFNLVDSGHAPVEPNHDGFGRGGDGSAFGEGLTFNSLRADLFAPRASSLIDEVGLGNAALQQVLAHLLLSRETRGRDRGFISYAELGINQLGAVYEGLMSYTGFFADTDLYEVANGGDASKGSWVVPAGRLDGIGVDDFVRTTDSVTGEEKPVLHERGTFVFRLAGRERQQSASYYTPEVLTRFTVGQALEELLDQDGPTPAADILGLTVCEPALGSGAFAIETVRQLAETYLQRRQEETGERIDPDEYPRRLQEVKAYLALHNVYGVDLNATAVELAEISLWLDTMVEGLDAPWFGLHLRRGNSLIGARRSVFRRDQLMNKTYLADVPRDVPLTSLAEDVATRALATEVAGSVHHFLLPAAGWGSAVESKEAKELAPAELARLRTWRKSVQAKPTKTQTDALIDLSFRAEALWQIALQRLEIAEREIRRAIPVWGAEALPAGGAVQREQIEAALADASGAYQRLRRVMDAWCALWFWPLSNSATSQEVDGESTRCDPPGLQQWIDALQLLLGRHTGSARTGGNGAQTLASGTSWEELDSYESVDLGFASAMKIESVLIQHPWLRVCERVAREQGFFHWELDFATIFARGGFGLQAGNPPWVRPSESLRALLAEGDARWQLLADTADAQMPTIDDTLHLPGVREFVVDSLASAAAMRKFLSSPSMYPALAGVQADLYRNFIALAWRNSTDVGVSALIHYETHFTEDGAGPFREKVYRRLRRHWGFINQLKLFEIGNTRAFGVNVYGPSRQVQFVHASWLYHPDTASRSLTHDGSGEEPGIKTGDGDWDIRPHARRVVIVDSSAIEGWGRFFGDTQGPLLQSKMLFAANRTTQDVALKLSPVTRVASLEARFSSGLQESASKTSGLIAKRWGAPLSADFVILQGSQIGVANPLFQEPGPAMSSHRDFAEVDLERLPASYLPVTAYKFLKPPLAETPSREEATREIAANEELQDRERFRVVWRNMADNVGEYRTLKAAIIPPGYAHIHSVTSMTVPSDGIRDFLRAAGSLTSLLCDFAVRLSPKSTISGETIERLPLADSPVLDPLIALRVLRLNCLTDAYTDLWHAAWSADFNRDSWSSPTAPYRRRPLLEGVAEVWTPESPLRIAADRRQALLELDVLVGLALGVTADELVGVYRTQFPVLRGYDRNTYVYDANGRLVPGPVLAIWRKKGDRTAPGERIARNQAGNTYTYELPFLTLDREVDMRTAYVHFESSYGSSHE